MSLNEQIAQDYKVAFKGHEDLRVSVLRMLRAEIKNREFDQPAALDDAQIVAIIRSQIKRREEAAEGFAKGGKPDMAAQERAEGEMLKTYLPPAFSEAELDELIAVAVEEAGARGPGDLGKVMKVLMPRVAGRADGKLVNERVRRALSV
jgi:hypothetical protein